MVAITRQLIVTSALIFGICFIGGCNNMIIFSEQKQLKRATDYLTEKYDDEFEYIRRYESNFGVSEARYLFKGKSFPNDEVLVCMDLKEGTCTDNYILISRKKEIEEYISNAVSSVYPSNIVRVVNSYNIPSQDYNASTAIDVITEDPTSNLRVFIFANNNAKDCEESVGEIKKQYKKNMIKGNYSLCIVPNVNNLSLSSNNDCFNYFSSYKGKKCTFIIDDNYEFSFIEWSE